jgi:hypothetical protein
MDEFRKISLRDYGKLILPFALFVVFGLILVSVPHHWRAAELIHKAGDAFLMAGLLAIGIELFSFKRLVRHVADDIAFRLAGGHLPAQMRRTLWSVISASDVRERWRKEYGFKPASGGMVTVTIQESYEVQNYGEKAMDYAPVSSEEEFWKPRVTYVEYRLRDGSGHAFNETQIAQYRTVDPDSHVQTIDGLPTLCLKPLREDSSAVCTVTWHATLTTPDEYTDITSFGGPTVGITIHLGELPDDMSFVARGGSDLRHVKGSRTWEFPDGFIGGQHVRVWWFKKTQT